MKMKMPHILVAGRSVVLASGDTFTPEGIPHGVRQVTRGSKEVAAEIVRDVEHVLVMAPRHHQTVAFYSSVVMSGNESENVGIHQDDRCFWN